MAIILMTETLYTHKNVVKIFHVANIWSVASKRIKYEINRL